MYNCNNVNNIVYVCNIASCAFYLLKISVKQYNFFENNFLFLFFILFLFFFFKLKLSGLCDLYSNHNHISYIKSFFFNIEWYYTNQSKATILNIDK